MDTTLLSGDWTAFSSSLPRVGSLAGLGMLVALALALLLTALFPPAEDSVVTAGDQPGGDEAVTPSRPSGDEPMPVAAAAGPGAVPLRGTALVHGATLSPTDLIALTALRRRVQAGEVADDLTANERLAFARWLVEHGRLAG